MGSYRGIVFLVVVVLCCWRSSAQGFDQKDEARFLQVFPQIIAAQYYTPYPSDTFKSQCVLGPGETGKLNYNTMTRVVISGPTSASKVQSLCSPSEMCIIKDTLTMDANLVVGMLMIAGGKLVWSDQTQNAPVQWLCAGAVSVNNSGVIDIGLSQKQAWIYIQNNGVADPQLGYRVFGGYNNASIYVNGRPMRRTWSLLASSPAVGSASISLMHDPKAMDWLVGDRVQIAPTTTGSKGTAETYYISGFGAAGTNTITLAQDAGLKTPAHINQTFKANFMYVDAEQTAEMSAEVINLSRNIIFSGDDFTNDKCVAQTKSNNPGDCICINGKSVCTRGFHTLLSGPGVIQMKYARFEKCGQRGILGSYCTHFHYIGECPNCIIEGNAFESAMQRGTEIHETQLAVVQYNVYTAVRGANVYVEDGNEIYNWILYNVAICNLPKDDLIGGCTIPGTFDDQADTSLNQAGFWGDSFQNYFIGNRAANSFNGMLWQAQAHEVGDGAVRGKECLNNQLIGRMEGNTFHGHGRFGTYILVSVFPKTTDRSLAHNATVNLTTCNAFDPAGNDRGAPQTIYRHVDYDNVFVGAYGLGDVQYYNHISVNNQNLIYWKETKNFADSCTAHIEQSTYSIGNMALPSGHGTLIIKDTTFSNHVSFEHDHHCGVGATGILCMPTYVLENVTMINPVTNQPWIHWGINNGAMMTLSPPECANADGKANFFPKGFCSVANPYWTYLLALDGGKTCLTSDAAQQATGLNYLTKTMAGGIMCRAPLRRLEIWVPPKTPNGGKPLLIQLYQDNKMISSQQVPYFAIGNTGKQGYAMTVVPGVDKSYKISFADGSGISPDWIIEFSDTIYGNRWTPDQIQLTVVGRTCPPITTSQHDRQYIWGDSNNNYLKAPGRGACTTFPDRPRTDCSKLPKIHLEEQCPQCSTVNCGENAYCDCGTKKCYCESGFSGPNCQTDICDSAKCDPKKAACTMRYLGGDLPATLQQCVSSA